MNCDSNVYSHTPYKPLQNWDYQQKQLCKYGLFMLKERFELLKFLYFSFRGLQTMLWFTLSLSFLCILSTRLILLRFCFLGKLTYLLFIYNRKCLLFFLQLDSLLLVCTIWTQNNTNIAKGNYNVQNYNYCPRFPHYSHIY
jgi:hypothetical protein